MATLDTICIPHEPGSEIRVVVFDLCKSCWRDQGPDVERPVVLFKLGPITKVCK